MRTSARELTHIPVWKGNRILDVAHAEKIRTGIGGDVRSLDSSIFHTVKYLELDATNTLIEQMYIIDGQHRAYILRAHFTENLCEPDFPILVHEKRVESESEAIEYFNTLNNVKPMFWEQDPRQMANKYVVAMEKEFNKDRKNILIRQGITKRPFLSSDTLRQGLEVHVKLLKQTPEAVAAFIQKVVEWNKRAVAEFQIKLAHGSEKNMSVMESAERRGFALAYNARLPWIEECLSHE